MSPHAIAPMPALFAALAALLVCLAPVLRVAAYQAFPESDANRTFDTTFSISPPPGSVPPHLRGATFQLYNYITPDYDPSRVRRAVIALHGLGRDAWGYFDQTNEALHNATSRRDRKSKRPRLARDEVVIMAPLFMNDEDQGGFPVDEQGNPTTSALVWPKNKWAEGADTILPATIYDEDGDEVSAPGISSFEALDEVIRYFSNQSVFPRLNTIIIAGHSLGAQMVQRYALIGSVPSGETPVHFVVANPGSFAYLSDWRPRNYAGCPETFNAWKFGLGSYGQRYLSDFISQSLDTSNDIESVVARYRRRVVSYLFGLADDGLGDTGCEARAQGLNHLSRGRNFVKHLSGMDDGFPDTHSVEYIRGVAHDALGMFTSRAGLERLFYINLDGTELPTAVGDDDRGINRWLFEQMNSACGESTGTTTAILSSMMAAATAWWLVST
ncbi:uncharacterized protein PFL1_03317 [Pseudozyma flocculosa PF-1]|uniref:AB hydrolase-1 domain-containing protein n=2 Tax=Pseudozyma flocculosa TaxID=84751 RepID=A0A5C3F9G0_9BASI|nr:uncharacterized protein PFL1_03317 [Pseudozyma flocculosa PF-1]EPQ29027.1 hypothetical protein PFL1_03317 [Pseudozyma flocculosa PF-1]SPO40021.1 uncharacterized protein PSFLO_05503 [Pseudozyma flocculosa]